MSHVAISGKKIHCVKKAKSVEKLSGGWGGTRFVLEAETD